MRIGIACEGMHRGRHAVLQHEAVGQRRRGCGSGAGGEPGTGGVRTRGLLDGSRHQRGRRHMGMRHAVELVVGAEVPAVAQQAPHAHGHHAEGDGEAAGGLLGKGLGQFITEAHGVLASEIRYGKDPSEATSSGL